jgi:hypothetical protein
MNTNGEATGNLSAAALAAAPHSVGKLTTPEKVPWHPVVGLPVEVPRPVEVRVRCDGDIQRIKFDGRRLRLLDHPDSRREKIVLALGATWCCYEVRDAWRRGEQQNLPMGLPAALESRWLAKLWAAYEASESPEETCAALERLERAINDRTTRAVKSAYCTFSYGNPPSSMLFQRFLVGDEPSASIENWSSCHEGGLGLPYPNVRVRPDWYYRVYERDFAVIDGKLVLDILTEADLPLPSVLMSFGRQFRVPSWIADLGDEPDLTQGPLALVVYQGPENTLCPRPARVVEEPGEDGKPRKVLKPLTSGHP